ncbi:MAG: hypothetical protein QOJ53_126 [Sphingomonadales bacterium]|jgi:hypothetical protein|nr:hypothetical protein [Sphingomonadales bacterium]MEA3045794.1 hypothetical protein [Sphingomonadales bacterium]
MGFRGAAAAAAFVAMTAAPAAAQSGWTGVGWAPASGDSGRVAINAHSDPRFRELMICVEGHAVRINDADIRFADDRRQSIRLRARIADGACSRMYTLNSRGKAIAAADVTYDTTSLAGGTVRVQLFAR